MSLNIREALANATPHGRGVEWSESYRPQHYGPDKRTGLRAWANYDITNTRPPVVWPVKTEA